MDRLAHKHTTADWKIGAFVAADMASSERDAFSALFEEEVRTVLRYARSRVGSAAADDIVAEVFAQAWRHRDRFDPRKGNARAWLLGIATNVIARERVAERQWLRARGLASDLALDRSDSSSDSAEAVVIDNELAMATSRDLMRALRRMPRSMRDPLLLHELAELSYEEISGALGVPLGTVRSRINRARRRLEGARP